MPSSSGERPEGFNFDAARNHSPVRGPRAVCDPTWQLVPGTERTVTPVAALKPTLSSAYSAHGFVVGRFASGSEKKELVRLAPLPDSCPSHCCATARHRIAAGSHLSSKDLKLLRMRPRAPSGKENQMANSPQPSPLCRRLPPWAEEAGGPRPSRLLLYLSSLRMVPTPWPSAIVAPLAFERFT